LNSVYLTLQGLAAIVARKADDRELSDERILGGSDFVESVLLDSEACKVDKELSVDDILNEVSGKSGVSREQILGASRDRRVSRARKEFFSIAHERCGATLSMLGRLTDRNHVAVRKAIEEMKSGRTIG
jgi:chromosomal replication initiation ATPase DnaA